MSILDRLKPHVSKRALLFVAAFIWGVAANRVLDIGLTDILNNTVSAWLYVAAGLVGAYFFFRYIFLKVFFKYATRIINLKTERPCMFSFFNFQGYAMMAAMIVAGIAIRQINIFPGHYVGAFYITIGTSLLLSSFCFLYSGIRYEYFQEKYLNRDEVI